MPWDGEDSRIKYFSTFATVFIVLAMVGTAGYIMFKPKDGDLSIITGIAARFAEEEKEEVLIGANKCFTIYDVQTSAFEDKCLITYDGKVYNVKDRLIRQGAFSISNQDCGRSYLVSELAKFPDVREQLVRYQAGRICE